jgi:hypothetical protein
MVEVLLVNEQTWTVRVGRDISRAEVKRIIGYRLQTPVTYHYESGDVATLVTFKAEAPAREFARWVG